MKKILVVFGTRPEAVKMCPLIRELKKRGCFRVIVCFGGQHRRMAEQVMEYFQIVPDYDLDVMKEGQNLFDVTLRVLERFQNVLEETGPDLVLVHGDTTTAFAAALACYYMRIPVGHVEAGLRSFNMSMPDEINRIVCDQVSSILFAPTETAMRNLRAEGFGSRPVTFAKGRRQEVYLSGDIMLDNSLHYATVSADRTDIIVRNGLRKADYILATIHRDSNTDDPVRLTAIFRAIVEVAENHRIRVVLPLHPRTAKLMRQQVEPDVLRRFTDSSYITLLPPASFFEMIELERNARLVLTDSGGVQKEAFFFGKPSVILRPETEWTEIVAHQAGLLVDADYVRILSACDSLLDTHFDFPPLFGDGHAARFILERLIAYLR